MASETPNPQSSAPWISVLERYLRWHIAAYVGVVVFVLLLHFVSPAERRLFIPMILWCVVVLAHYLTVRAINTDPDWVDERSETITMNASDLSHIENIRERHDKRMAEAKRPDSDNNYEEVK